MPSALESTIVMAVITLVSSALPCRATERPSCAAPRARMSWSWLGVSDALNVLLFFAAYKHTVAVAVLTHYLTPVFVALAAPFVLRERIDARAPPLAVGLSFVGLVVMLASGGERRLDDRTRSGGAPALGAGERGLLRRRTSSSTSSSPTSFSTSETMFFHGLVADAAPRRVRPAARVGRRRPARGRVPRRVAALGPGALAGLAFVWGLRRMPAATRRR